MTTAAERRRRVLLVTVELRVPAISGREHRYWQHVVALRENADVGVLVLDRHGRSPTRAPDGIAWWRHVSEPWLDEAVEWMRQPDGHPAYGRVPGDGLLALDETLRDFDPDVIVVAGLWLHRHLDRLRENGRQVILDAADIEGSLYEDLAKAPSRGERMVRAVLARHVAEIEGRAVSCVDQVWACSEHDARAIEARYPAAACVAVVPNTVDAESLRRPGSPRPSAPTVVYPASFGYAPNQAAALSLITHIHPLVRGRFPSATLSLVGTGPTAAMHAAAAAAHGVTVTGAVPDTRPWLWGSTVLAAPLHVGSGTRIKFLEAFAAGLPVVSTPKGAEGLDVVDGEHLLIARSPRQFADAIGDLHASPETRSALAARARQLVDDRYSRASARRAVECAMAQLPVRTP